jgi:hypothetical protein
LFIDRHEELQSSILHKKIQPIEHLEEVIEEIRESMLKSTKYVVSKEKLNRGGSVRVARMQQKKQSRGAGG